MHRQQVPLFREFHNPDFTTLMVISCFKILKQAVWFVKRGLFAMFVDIQDYAKYKYRKSAYISLCLTLLINFNSHSFLGTAVTL